MRFFISNKPFEFMGFKNKLGEIESILLPTYADLWHYDEVAVVCPTVKPPLPVQDPFRSATSLVSSPKSSV